MRLREFLTGNKGRIIPKHLNEFNWGAFLLPLFWGIAYKAWISVLVIPLILIKMPLYANWILLIILQFYFGINGNKLAYQKDFWKSPTNFRKTQERWATIAIVPAIGIPMISLSQLLDYANSHPEQMIEFLKNL